MYKVTNQAKDVRKFRDKFLGKDIYVEPGKSVIIKKPLLESEIWKVEPFNEKKLIKLQEVKK